MIDSRRGFLSGSSSLPIHQNYKSVHESESVCADKWTLSQSVWCWTQLCFLTKEETISNNPPIPKKLPLKQKESNYWYQLNSEWNTSRSCTAPTFIFFRRIRVCLRVCTCAHWCARICVCVHSLVLPTGPLKLHTLLSGLSSQQAHLEMRFKTAINIELCEKKRVKGVILKLFCWGLVQITTGRLEKADRKT